MRPQQLASHIDCLKHRAELRGQEPLTKSKFVSKKKALGYKVEPIASKNTSCFTCYVYVYMFFLYIPTHDFEVPIDFISILYISICAKRIEILRNQHWTPSQQTASGLLRCYIRKEKKPTRTSTKEREGDGERKAHGAHTSIIRLRWFAFGPTHLIMFHWVCLRYQRMRPSSPRMYIYNIFIYTILYGTIQITYPKSRFEFC